MLAICAVPVSYYTVELLIGKVVKIQSLLHKVYRVITGDHDPLNCSMCREIHFGYFTYNCIVRTVKFRPFGVGCN